MERKLKGDSIQFNVTSGVTIEEFNEKYNQLVQFLKDKYGHITDIKISCHSYNYDDGESYENVIDIHYKRYETVKEINDRTRFKRAKSRETLELDLLKHYMESHKEEAVKYMKELKLI